MNKKKLLIIKLIFLILIFIMMSYLAIYYFSYSGFESIVVIDGEEKIFSNVEKIVVELVNLPINIYESDVSQVTIKDNSKVYGFIIGKPNTIDEKDGVISIKQGKGISFFSMVRGNIIVEVPRESILEYNINNISGNIDHDAISRDTLKAKTISGNISINRQGEKAIIKTTSGLLSVYSPFEELSAKSVSGNVRIVANEDSREVLSKTVSGSIKIQLENVLGYDMDYSTTSGGVRDAYKNIDYSKLGNAIQGDSSLEIKVSSVSGSVNLIDWNIK